MHESSELSLSLSLSLSLPSRTGNILNLLILILFSVEHIRWFFLHPSLPPSSYILSSPARHPLIDSSNKRHWNSFFFSLLYSFILLGVKLFSTWSACVMRVKCDSISEKREEGEWYMASNKWTRYTHKEWKRSHYTERGHRRSFRQWQKEKMPGQQLSLSLSLSLSLFLSNGALVTCLPIH